LATVLDKTTSNINPFTKTRFDLGICTSIPKTISKPDLFLESKDELKQDHADYVWENTKVRSSSSARLYPELYYGRKDIPVFWTKKDGDKRTFSERVKEGKVYRRITHSCSHYTEPQKIHDRNFAIAEIRDKYLSKTKRGQKYYEKQANHFYENDEAYQAFLKEVEQKGHVRKAEKKKLGDNTKQLFELGLIKGTNAEGLDEDNFYSLKDLDRFQREEVLD
jgi:hypothetical protein